MSPDEKFDVDCDRIELAINIGKQAIAEVARLSAINAALVSACRQAIIALKGREHDGFLRDAIEKAES